MTAYGGADVLLHAFLNLVLCGSECWNSHFSCFSRKKEQPVLIE